MLKLKDKVDEKIKNLEMMDDLSAYPETIQCFLLDLKTACDEEEEPLFTDEASKELLKMQNPDEIKKYAVSLENENKILKTQLETDKHFNKMRIYFDENDHNRLYKICEKQILKEPLSISELDFLTSNSASNGVELKKREIKKEKNRQRIIRLGGIKQKVS